MKISLFLELNQIILQINLDIFFKKTQHNLNKVTKFVEKPSHKKAKIIIKKKGYWNSGMFLSRKDSIIYNFKKFQKKIYQNTFTSVNKAKSKKYVYYLN